MIATTDIPLADPSLVIPGPTEARPPSTITHARAASERHFLLFVMYVWAWWWLIHVYTLLAFSALRTAVYRITDRVCTVHQ